MCISCWKKLFAVQKSVLALVWPEVADTAVVDHAVRILRDEVVHGWLHTGSASWPVQADGTRALPLYVCATEVAVMSREDATSLWNAVQEWVRATLEPHGFDLWHTGRDVFIQTEEIGVGLAANTGRVVYVAPKSPDEWAYQDECGRAVLDALATWYHEPAYRSLEFVHQVPTAVRRYVRRGCLREPDSKLPVAPVIPAQEAVRLRHNACMSRTLGKLLKITGWATQPDLLAAAMRFSASWTEAVAQGCKHPELPQLVPLRITDVSATPQVSEDESKAAAESGLTPTASAAGPGDDKPSAEGDDSSAAASALAEADTVSDIGLGALDLSAST